MNTQSISEAEMQLPDVAGVQPLTAHRRPALPALTGLRFFAAMYVVLHHTGFEYAKRHHASRMVTTFLDRGVASVALFFVLSGFILAYTYKGQIGGKTRRFLEARFARIYPVYLLSLLLSLAVSMPISLPQRVVVLAMMQTWIPGHTQLVTAWNYPAWTLSAEVAFYLFFPLFMLLFERQTPRVLWSALSICLAVSALTASVAHQPSTEAAWSHWALLTPYPLLRIPEFFIGVLLGLIFLETGSVRYPVPLLLGSIISLIVLLVIPSSWGLNLTILPFTVLVYVLAGGQTWLAHALSARTMLFLGGASYSIYLLQVPVRAWTRLLFQHLPTALRSLDFLASPVLLLLLSCLVFRFYEEPARRWLRTAFTRVTT